MAKYTKQGLPKFADGNRVKKGKGMAALGLFDRLGADATTLMNARNNTKFGDLGPPTSGVVKEAGGNWLTGSIENAVDTSLQKQMIGNKYHAYGPEYEAAAEARLRELRREANQPRYVGGAPRVIEAIEQGLASPESARKAAVNQWVKKNAANYLKNEMGTEGDRVRKLLEDRWNAVETKYQKAEKKAEAMQAKRDAEPDERKHAMMDRQIQQFKVKAKQDYEDEKRHIGHIPRLNEDPYTSRRDYDTLREEREQLGYPPSGQANAPTAQNWENLTDSQIKTQKAWQLNHYPIAGQNPFLEKIPPSTPVHQLKSTTYSVGSEIGLPHIIDRMEQAIESGAIKPEKLSSITMDQAVRMAADMDLADTRKAREAIMKQAENLKVEKDYPDAGMRWVDLDKTPLFSKDSLPEGWEWQEPRNGMHRLRYNGPEPSLHRTFIGETPEEAVEAAHARIPEYRDKQRKALREALEYESDVMGHCVGRSSAYCDKVMSGQGRILSLRNSSNEPHVTIETSRRPVSTWDDVTELLGPKKAEELYNSVDASAQDSVQQLMAQMKLPTHIEEVVQVKGKSNAAPVEKYLPYVQNLIRERNFPVTSDFANTGLRDINTVYDVLPPHAEKHGLKLPRYLTEQERSDLYNHWDNMNTDVTEIPESLLQYKIPTPPAEGMKEGGIVKHSHHYHQIARDFDLPHLSDGGEVVDGTAKHRAQMIQDMYAHMADMRKHFNKGGSTGPRRSQEPESVNYQDPMGIPSAPITDDTRAAYDTAKDYAGAFKDAASNAYYSDKRNLVTPRGKKEFALQAAANLAGTPVDIGNMLASGLDATAGQAMGKVFPSLMKPVSVLDPNGEKVLAYPLSSDKPRGGSADMVERLGHDYEFYSAPVGAMAMDLGMGMAGPAGRMLERGANKGYAAARRPFTPATMTVEATAPDLGQRTSMGYRQGLNDRLISSERGGTDLSNIGGRPTTRREGQGAWMGSQGFETNPLAAIDVPRAGDLSKNAEFRRAMAQAGTNLNQEGMAAHRFLPNLTSNPRDASAMLIKPKKGALSNEQVVGLAKELGNRMVVAHNPRLGGVVVHPFGEAAEGDKFVKQARAKARKVLGNDASIKYGRADINKDRAFMMGEDYAGAGAMPADESVRQVREMLKRQSREAFPNGDAPTGGVQPWSIGENYPTHVQGIGNGERVDYRPVNYATGEIGQTVPTYAEAESGRVRMLNDHHRSLPKRVR